MKSSPKGMLLRSKVKNEPVRCPCGMEVKASPCFVNDTQALVYGNFDSLR